MDLVTAPPYPITVRQPTVQSAPIVFTSPHSGRAYSEAFLALSRLDPSALRRSEDCFVEELFDAAPRLGMPLLAAEFPRAWCDPNRAAWELDPAMFADRLPPWVSTNTPRVRAGLGTVARVVSSGETIHRRKLRFDEAAQRIQSCWQPFHAALATLIEATMARFGHCLLIDCHSMPAARGVPDMVLGDAHGRACGSAVSGALAGLLRQAGYTVGLNDPYAGGFITRHYGRPHHQIHAIQIEIARRLYMREDNYEKLPAFHDVRQNISALISRLAASVHDLIG